MKEEKKTKKYQSITVKNKKSLLKGNISKDKLHINDNKKLFNENNSKDKTLEISNIPTKKNIQIKKNFESEQNLKQLNFPNVFDKVFGYESKNRKFSTNNNDFIEINKKNNSQKEISNKIYFSNNNSQEIKDVSLTQSGSYQNNQNINYKQCQNNEIYFNNNSYQNQNFINNNQIQYQNYDNNNSTPFLNQNFIKDNQMQCQNYDNNPFLNQNFIKDDQMQYQNYDNNLFLNQNFIKDNQMQYQNYNNNNQNFLKNNTIQYQYQNYDNINVNSTPQQYLNDKNYFHTLNLRNNYSYNNSKNNFLLQNSINNSLNNSFNEKTYEDNLLQHHNPEIDFLYGKKIKLQEENLDLSKSRENDLSTSNDKINFSNEDYKKVEAFNKIIKILKEEKIRESLSAINEKDEENIKSSKKSIKINYEIQKGEDIEIIGYNNTKQESIDEIFNFITNENSEINFILSNFIYITSNQFKTITESKFNDYLIQLINKLNIENIDAFVEKENFNFCELFLLSKILAENKKKLNKSKLIFNKLNCLIILILNNSNKINNCLYKIKILRKIIDNYLNYLNFDEWIELLLDKELYNTQYFQRLYFQFFLKKSKEIKFNENKENSTYYRYLKPIIYYLSENKTNNNIVYIYQIVLNLFLKLFKNNHNIDVLYNESEILLFNEFIKKEYYEFKEEDIKIFGEYAKEEIDMINLIEKFSRENDNKEI